MSESGFHKRARRRIQRTAGRTEHTENTPRCSTAVRLAMIRMRMSAPARATAAARAGSCL